jgi:transcription elongation factor Elf1
MKQIYVVDLTKMKGDGDFNCPQCGVFISPDDSTEEKYTLLEPKINGNELEEVIIHCKNCGSNIRLTGFSIQEISWEIVDK